MLSDKPEKKVLIHIIVVGFHHKKGCQVEFCYPPFNDGDDLNCPVLPDEWKCLPSLALPDGAHNFDEDTIYFHLPPRSHFSIQSTVYGVSCYRQIAASLLKRKDSDVTRETVQKSVVALSQLPIYGILHAKLKMITQAYFEEKDFAKSDILKELFIHMNMQASSFDDSKRYFGLTPRSLVMKFQHKIMVLFKLILLERRVLFYTSPVEKLVGGIMSLLCLFPNMIEKGLAECTVSDKQYREKIKQESARIGVDVEGSDAAHSLDCIAQLKTSVPSQYQEEASAILPEHSPDEKTVPTNSNLNDSNKSENTAVFNKQISKDTDGIVLSSLLESKSAAATTGTHSSTNIWEATSEAAISIAASVSSRLESLSSTFSHTLYREENLDDSRFESLSEIEDDDEHDKLQMGFKNARLEIKADSPAKSRSQDPESMSKDSTSLATTTSKFEVVDNFKSHFQIDDCGFPLSVFSRGYLCLPYIALQQFSELTENYDRGYVIGATNILFKTQTRLADVVIDMENALLDIRDLDLKRQLHLSAADLRFAENLVNNVSSSPEDDVFFDATGWEGGDEWIQAQFSDYLISLLAISLDENPNPKDMFDFNEHFIAAWKNSKNFQVWASQRHKGMDNAKPLHPCQAQYTVNDVRLRFHHNLQSSDRGRKIEGAMNSANQAVVNTGKYMGTALISAKSSVSSWWSKKMKKEP